MSDTTSQEAFNAWFSSLTIEQKYDFDPRGRGYKKPCEHMMRLAFDAGRAITAPQAQEPLTLTEKMQQMCCDWGTYWRASDAHGVDLTHEQALELLRFALGVEVTIAAAQEQTP